MEKLIRYAKVLALLSFLIGTSLFVVYFLTGEGTETLLPAFYFTYGAALLNLLMALALLSALVWNRSAWRKVLKAIGLMSMNVPVLILYISIIFRLMETERLTLVNDRQEIMTDVKIYGCENHQISRIEPGESKTIWVGIKGECSIDLSYTIHGAKVDEVVDGYLCSGQGKRMIYHVDGKVRPPL